MSHSHQGRFRQQVNFLRRQFLQEGHLPFTDVLSVGSLSQALEDMAVCWNDRIFTPLVTLWVFLGQVLSADHSCRAAVARLIAHRVSQGLRPCSAETGAYCQARKRLPERFFSVVAHLVGRTLDAQVDPQWLWKGRRVYLFDGSTVSMPDTPENQQAYPQLYNQKPGTGFPIARIGAERRNGEHLERIIDFDPRLAGFQRSFEVLLDKRLLQSVLQIEHQVSSICPEQAARFDSCEVRNDSSKAIDHAFNHSKQIAVIRGLFEDHRGMLFSTVVDHQIDLVFQKSFLQVGLWNVAR